MVFRWLFIPWLQQELDSYKSCMNNTRKCRDRNKVSCLRLSLSIAVMIDTICIRFFLMVSQNWYMAPLKTTGLLILRCARFYVSGSDSHNAQLRVMVSHTAINHVHELYINPTHPVFDLLPPTLSAFIDQCYNQMGHPSVERMSI